MRHAAGAHRKTRRTGLRALGRLATAVLALLILALPYITLIVVIGALWIILGSVGRALQ